MKSKKSKSKLDFLPNRNNRYSIRRFTVGTASILIGATLLFGASHDAQAAEEDSSSVSVDGQDEAGASKDDQTAKASEEQATPAQTEDVKASTEAEASTDTETQAQADKEEAASTQEDAVSEDSQSKAQDSEQVEEATPAQEEAAQSEGAQTTEHASVKEAKSEDKKVDTESATTSEVPQATEEEVATKEESKAVQPATVADKKAASVDPSPYANIGNVNDKASAEEFYAKATGVSAKEAKRVVNNLGLDAKNITPESFRAALLKAFSNAQNRTAVQGLSFRAAPEDSEAINDMANAVNATAPTADDDNMKIIDADAYKNGYVKNDVDTTNAANTLSGRAYMSDFGAPGTTSTRLTTVPEGTAVYMQWIDKDGWVSPAFRAYTTNQITDRDSSAAGPGFYAFDLRKPQIDANGKSHVYNATDGQYYRLWIEDFETPNGNTATMLRQVDGLIPGTFVNSVTHLNLGQFPLIGKNMQRTGVFMGVRPTNDYMTRPKEEWIHDEEGPMTNPYTDLKAKNTVSGRVWLETGDGDEENSGTGPNRNPGDPVAQGYTVVMSSLTKEGAAAYKDQVQSLDHGQRAEAAKKLLEDHPEYISATVYGETDEDGHYTLRFPKDALDVNFLYGYVMDKDGVIQNAYSSYTAPEFRTPNTNALFTPQAIPAHNLVADPMWYNVHFAVIPRTDVEISIVDFNNTDKPAAPGDVAHIDLEGKILSPLPTHVEWRDSKGKVVKKTPDFTSLKEGEDAGTFEIPADAKDGDHCTAVLVVNDRDVSADSLTVKVTDAHTYEPEVTPITKDYGTPTTEDDVKNAVTVPDYPADKGTPKVTIDEGAELPDGNTEGTVNVPVTVTYPDGTTAHVNVPVTTKAAEDNTKMPQVDNVTAGDKTVSGHDGQPGNTVVVTFPGDKTGTATVDDNGKWTVNVPSDVTLKPGDKVTAVEKDHNGHTSPATEVTVGDYPNTAHQPTVDPVTAGDKTVHGKGTPGNTVEVTLPGGTVVTGEVDENGNFTVKVPDGTTLKPGDEITVVEKDHHGHASTPTKVTVGDTANEAHQPTVDPIHGGDKTVHGKGTPGNTVEVTLPDGSTVTGEVDKDGNFTIEVPDGKELKPGDKVTVVEKDKDGHSSTPTEVTVGDYPNTAHQPTVDPVTAGDKTVHGKGTPGNTVEVTLPDGSVVTGTVDKDGNFTVKVPDGTTLKPGQVITVVEKDKHGHASTPTKVTVGDTANEAHQPQVDPIHGGDSSIGGKGTPGNTVEVTLPDGSKVTGTIDKDGNFTIDLPDGKELKPGDKVTVVEKDKDGHTSPATEVTVGDYPNTAHQPTVDPIHSGDKTVTGKGTPGNTIELTTPCGKTLTTKVDKDGNWSIDLPEDVHLKAGDKVTVVEKDQYGHTSTPTVVTVTDKEMNGNNCDMPKKDDNGQAPMDNHGSDMNKGDMTEHASTPAMTQGSDMAQGHDDSMKHAEAKDDAKSEAKALPETGNTDNSGTIFGSLFAALGALFLAGRRRKKEDK
ncbi:Ig-like domain-containing protein [Staphylococcus pettenkoferi]|uniref:Ig-like domain-containing protein n=1 Tax=Staphylococcus pettenkoferi TaxID=170573 RepID=UPI002272B6A0|nr:Ig-like domain-containing protein [Staphylococcus pettenkoferi]MCY1565183.1 Ig-like domain-containing protein [Staphylococcus pettenkoferi]